jgi:hypothetical protein
LGLVVCAKLLKAKRSINPPIIVGFYAVVLTVSFFLNHDRFSSSQSAFSIFLPFASFSLAVWLSLKRFDAKGSRILVQFFYFLFVLNAVVVFAQLLLVTESPDYLTYFWENQKLNTVVVSFDGGDSSILRAPGVFSNGASSATLSLLVAIGAWANFPKTRKRLLVVIFTLSAAIIFFSYTRKLWLISLFSILVIAMYELGYLRSVKKLLAGTMFFFATFASYSAVVGLDDGVLAKVDAEGALNSASLIMRLGQWQFYFDDIAQWPLEKLFFGSGYLQEFGEFYPTSLPFIDNVFIAVIMHSGLIGMLCYALLWGYSLNEAIRSRDYVTERASFSLVVLWVSMTFISLGHTYFTSLDGLLAFYLYRCVIFNSMTKFS